MTTLDLKGIANSGGSLIIDANLFTTLDLKGIASSLKDNACLIIKNADSKTTLDLKGIANSGRGKVIFDFTN